MSDGDGHRSETAYSQAYLETFNPAQRKAVTHAPANLQILAGPGSGKTRVLMARVAFLAREMVVNPSEIMCLTFTNKAAKEMGERLTLLVGENIRSDVAHLGTFHAMASNYLRKHGHLINIKRSFTIADASDSERTLKRIVDTYAKEIMAESLRLKAKEAMNAISKAKANSIRPNAYIRFTSNSPFHQIMQSIYTDYQTELSRQNALDFDDLLMYLLELSIKHPEVFANISHVLVDEFQDTNTIQYQILRRIARNADSLTIVGDPDQSIYGWRKWVPCEKALKNTRISNWLLFMAFPISAQIENLNFMKNDFDDVQQVFLEQNYRSSTAVLESAAAIIGQDKKRIAKNLITDNPSGPPVSLIEHRTQGNEASFIASEVKRLIAYTGGLLSYNDFSILLRYGALSRHIETALRGKSIPYRMVGGHKFFDRVEVKDVIAYLQLADNPDYSSALYRVINVPKRGVGEKTISDLRTTAEQVNMSPFSLLCDGVNGRGSAKKIVRPALLAKLKNFVDTVHSVSSAAAQGTNVHDLIHLVQEGIGYQEYLKTTYGAEEAAERWENVMELATFAQSSSDLGEFLNTSMLATDSETEKAKKDANEPKVTISTAHASKGLEWPVVFIPGLNEGSFPFYLADSEESIDEERRLLFVAMTRAQTHLYLTRPLIRQRRGGGDGFDEETRLSNFIHMAKRKLPDLFNQENIEMNSKIREEISKILCRQPIDETTVSSHVSDFLANDHQQLKSITSNSYGGAYGPGGTYAGMLQSRNNDFKTPQRAHTIASQYGYSQPSENIPDRAGSFGGFTSAREFHNTQNPGKMSTLKFGSMFSTASAKLPHYSSKRQPSRVKSDPVGKGTVNTSSHSALADQSITSVETPPQQSLSSFQESHRDSITNMKNLGKDMINSEEASARQSSSKKPRFGW